MVDVGKELASNVDADYWSKMPKWSVEEATLLTIGVDPLETNADRLSAIKDSLQYRKTRDLIERANVANHFTHSNAAMSHDPVDTNLFICWIDNHDIAFPEKLKRQTLKAIERNGDDPKTLKRQLKTFQRMAESSQNMAKAGFDLRKVHDKLREEREKNSAEKTASSNKGNAKPLHLKEKESLFKMIIGMAIKGYGHNPKAKRTQTAPEIRKDLELLGLNLDEDTIRKWLKESAEILPPQDDL